MKNKKVKKIIAILFALYFVALVYVLFLHNTYRYDFNAIGINNYFSKEHMQMINIIPFKTIFGYFQRLAEYTINTDIVVRNLFVNLILFLPMGMAIPVLCENRINRFWEFLIFIIITTFFVEIIQFFTMRGTADIDDIILNSIGGCIGYGIIQIKAIRKLFKLEG